MQKPLCFNREVFIISSKGIFDIIHTSKYEIGHSKRLGFNL